MERCNEHIKEANPDPDRIHSLVKIATARIKALNQIKADEETVSIIVEQHYEAIKELLTALLLKDSKKSSSHECLIEYFRMKYNYPYEADFLQDLRRIRNQINYEGLLLDFTYLERFKLEIKYIFELVKNLISHQP